MSNRLAAERSPYLRQHADNPVDWQPWDAAAQAQALAQDKPILLSIGYSACHWCHVMAHECFEDEAIASVMNRHFVNIKVDREERPDLDRIYQLAHQALTGRGGGWPLTVFLTPDDRLPFFAGTYFPPTPRHGLPAFPQLLEGVARWFHERRDEVSAQNARLQAFLDEFAATQRHDGEIDRTPIERALELLARQFDPVHGGRRGGPKFPHAQELELLLRVMPVGRHPVPPSTGGEGGAAAWDAALRSTLDAMADRGLYDHLGGGFFRYCVDEAWTIPHFEKMLYDNAQLLPLYAQASRRFGEARYREVAGETIGWLAREMTMPGGGLASALDADSEGGEGAYYVWRREEVEQSLPVPQARLIAARYGLDGPPNFENHAWHLLIAQPMRQAAAAAGIDAADAAAQLDQARATLHALRERRPRPGLDDKILTAWNALAIVGLARTARALGDAGAQAQAMADAALDHLHEHAWRNGRLHADDGVRLAGYLDDHAFLLDALVEQLRNRWRSRDIEWAQALADALLDRFEDAEQGGFFFTAHDHERLPQRPKPFADDALPSGNAIATRALLAIGHLLGETRYLDAAERCLRAGWTELERFPHACCALLRALADWLEPPAQLIVRAPDARVLAPWREAMAGIDVEATNIFQIPDHPGLPSRLAAMAAPATGAAYLCRGRTCSPALLDPRQLPDLLRSGGMT